MNTTKRRSQFMGTTENGTFVFMNVEINLSSEDELIFTANFDEVAPIILNHENLKNRAITIVECIEPSKLEELGIQQGLSLEEAAEQFINRRGFYCEEVVDMSLTNHLFFLEDISDDDIALETVGCGQEDYTGRFKREFDGQANDDILRLWKAKHMKQITRHQMKKVLTHFDYTNDEQEREFLKDEIVRELG